jgi:hypothetical protein
VRDLSQLSLCAGCARAIESRCGAVRQTGAISSRRKAAHCERQQPPFACAFAGSRSRPHCQPLFGLSATAREGRHPMATTTLPQRRLGGRRLVSLNLSLGAWPAKSSHTTSRAARDFVQNGRPWRGAASSGHRRTRCSNRRARCRRRDLRHSRSTAFHADLMHPPARWASPLYALAIDCELIVCSHTSSPER